MATLLLGILEQVLKLGVLSMEEKHKYDDDILKLKKAYYVEYSRPENEISDNNLDDLDLQLRLLGESIEQALRAKNS